MIGLYGVTAATFVSAASTGLPVGLHLLEAKIGVTANEVLTQVCWLGAIASGRWPWRLLRSDALVRRCHLDS